MNKVLFDKICKKIEEEDIKNSIKVEILKGLKEILDEEIEERERDVEELGKLKIYHQIICNNEYNKAIDDFADRLKEMANNSSTKYIRVSEKETMTTYGVEQIAERLKKGAYPIPK